jgi:hypothetical protein
MMNELDEKNDIDQLFETRTVLQDRGSNAFFALQYLIKKKKLDHVLYPELNTLMINIIDKYDLIEEYKAIDKKEIYKFLLETYNSNNMLEADESAKEIRAIVSKYINIPNCLSPGLFYYQNLFNTIYSDSNEVESILSNEEVVKIIEIVKSIVNKIYTFKRMDTDVFEMYFNEARPPLNKKLHILVAFR